MSRGLEDSVEHDHTRLEVIWEDLQLLVQGLVSTGGRDERADAVRYWRELTSLLQAHFEKEEATLFHELVQERPEMAAKVAILTRQHRLIDEKIVRLGAMIMGSEGGPPLLAQDLLKTWRGLDALWENHTEEEWRALAHLRDDSMPR